MKIGIDLGGTKTEIVVLADDKEHSVVFRKRVPTPRNDYQGTIDCIHDLVKEASIATNIKEVKSIGIAIPGTISPVTGLIKNANSTWLNNKPFHHDLSNQIGCEVKIANDANCMALSEACDGAGEGHPFVFAIILGTGCGAGVAINKSIHVGKNGLGGEWGHNPLPWMSEDEHLYSKNIKCYCGLNGCIEHFLSGTGFANYYNYRREQLSGVKLTRSVVTLSSPEVFALADCGDKLALECVELYEHRLARALANVINILDPDIIVAAGGMSNIDRIYPNVNRQVKSWVFGKECSTQFVKSKHGDSSGVRGAAWLNSN